MVVLGGLRSAGNLHRPAAAGTSGRAAPFHGPPRRRVSCASASAETSAAAASQAGAAFSISEVSRMRKGLRLQLEAAIKAEDYAKAANVKRELSELDAQDPIVQAKTALERAIKEERYQDAAQVQAQLKQLETELGAAALDSGLLSTSSDTVTRGVRVKVQSFFVPTQSDPRNERYMYAYKITVSNEGAQIVQLRQRHWIIMDANGKVEEVRGPGVVGEQPILVPGKSFEYTSGCPLSTPQGCMEGEYMMWLLNEEDGEWKETMEVKIGRFKLDEKGPQIGM